MNQRRRILALILILVLLMDCRIDCDHASAQPVYYGINNPRTQEDGTVIWDKIKFGNYEQTAKFTPEPIKWRILSLNEDKTEAFVMADKALAIRSYNNTKESVTWKDCSLRTWLNTDFYNVAFNSDEKLCIKDSDVTNSDNSKYFTEGGEDTTDKVYLLSEDEAGNIEYGFEDKNADSNTRKMYITDYGKVNGVKQRESGVGAKQCSWWLRSVGEKDNEAEFVGKYGYVSVTGNYVTTVGLAVCPVMHIDLTSEYVKDAGEVYSDGRTGDMEDGYYPPERNNGITMWDCIYFGHYEQNADYDREPIEWRVLSVDGDDALLLSDKALDCIPYHFKKSEYVNWSNCTLRNWLNDTFMYRAFTKEERSAITTTTLRSNKTIGLDKDIIVTHDNVFILSLSDLERISYGFNDEYTYASKNRIAKATDYSCIKGEKPYNKNDCLWWTRDINSNNFVLYTWYDGKCAWASYCDDCYINVRPALHIDLSKTVWSYSGTVDSEGKETASGSEVNPEPYPVATPSAVPDDIPDIDKINSPRKDENGVVTWDKIKLGKYEQNATFHSEPIKWKILYAKRDGSDAVVIADKALDCFPYNDTYESITWKDCTLRKWLNEDFIYKAFSEEERAIIKDTQITNDDNEKYGIEGGEDTTDRIYVLSEKEANNNDYGYYFKKNDYQCVDRIVKETDYAKINGVTGYNGVDNCFYWLRTPGNKEGYAAYISNTGACEYIGKIINKSVGVCPVMRIDLRSELVEDAGEVDSNGNITMLNNGYHSPRRDNNITTWDCIYFGNYKQNAEYEKESIEWKVLLRRENDAFIISDKALDSMPYDDTLQNGVIWEECSLRKWLNNEFYNSVFTEEEKAIIKKSFVVNNRSKSDDYDNMTTERLYCLSDNEARNERYGFDSNTFNRLQISTDYATNRGVIYSKTEDKWGGCFWWLRTVDGDINARRNALVVNDAGNVQGYGNRMEDKTVGVCPVMHINLASYAWEYAGTTNSAKNGGQTPTASPTAVPTASPTVAPTASPTAVPTASPTVAPTASPTAVPTASPTAVPTASPTVAPTASPTVAPTESPTAVPTASPTVVPMASPTVAPTESPTAVPTASPTAVPMASPTAVPTASPTAVPTASPTVVPMASPTLTPNPSPSQDSTATPMVTPSSSPTATPIAHINNTNIINISGDSDSGNVNNSYTYNINNYNHSNTEGTVTDNSSSQNNNESNQKVKNIEYKNSLYRIISKNNAMYIRPKVKSVRVIRIPATIRYKGKNYKVTEINKKACYKLNGLRTVMIGKNVTYIGKKAFSKCSNLSMIVFGKAVKKLGDGVLAGDKNLKTIKYTGSRITSFGKHTFSGVTRKTDIIIPKNVQGKYVNLIKKSR